MLCSALAALLCVCARTALLCSVAIAWPSCVVLPARAVRPSRRSPRCSTSTRSHVALKRSPLLRVQLLQQHIVFGAYKTSDLHDGQTLETTAGTTLKVSFHGPEIKITAAGGGTVATLLADSKGSANIMACLSVIHVIDEVCLSFLLAPVALSRASVQREPLAACRMPIACAMCVATCTSQVGCC
jgi:Fasciclin domain